MFLLYNNDHYILYLVDQVITNINHKKVIINYELLYNILYMELTYYVNIYNYLIYFIDGVIKKITSFGVEVCYNKTMN